MRVRLWYPGGVAVDAQGDVYVADTMDNTVRRVTPGGMISTVAGTGSTGGSAGSCPSGVLIAPPSPSDCGDGGSATSAQLNSPQSVAVDAQGNLYIADTGDHRVRKVTPDGIISTIAGTGAGGCTDPCGEGELAASTPVPAPEGVAVDGQGNVYIVAGGFGGPVRKVTPDGRIRTIADLLGQRCGDGGTIATDSSCDAGGMATKALFYSPVGVAVDRQGNVYVGDKYDHQVRKITPDGTISTIAGTGTPCAAAASASCDGGGVATNAQLDQPYGVAVDAQGNVYIADSNDQKVREVTPEGKIVTVAGSGADCGGATDTTCGGGGDALRANLDGPQGVAVDGQGNVYIADTAAQKILKVSSNPSGGPQPGGPQPGGATGGPSCDTRTASAVAQSSGLLADARRQWPHHRGGIAFRLRNVLCADLTGRGRADMVVWLAAKRGTMSSPTP